LIKIFKPVFMKLQAIKNRAKLGSLFKLDGDAL